MKKLKLTAIIFMLIAMIGFAGGCGPGNQTATQQMASQTSDPALIALATYADALEAYVSAQDIYLPYQQMIKQKYPDVDKKVIEYFRQARGILNLWKSAGAVSAKDKADFRAALREITLAAAKQLDSK